MGHFDFGFPLEGFKKLFGSYISDFTSNEYERLNAVVFLFKSSYENINS